MNNKMLALGLDAAVMAGLVFVLMTVVGVDALLTHFYPSQPEPVVVSKSGSTTKKVTRETRLAVTKPYESDILMPNGVYQRVTWDEVGKLLDQMGDYYRYDSINEDALRDLDKLKQYDVVFCSCTAVKSDPDVARAIQAYVAQGGTLYASDWRYDLVAAAFPEVRDPKLEGPGRDVKVNAEVVDPGLRDLLASNRVELTFELNEWKPAAFSGDRVKVLLKGKYTGMDGISHSAPLLVKFSYGKGNVIFTSYHHGKTHSDSEKKLLKYLVHSLVTAKVSMEIEKVLQEGGFSPPTSNPFSVSKDNPKITYAYQHTYPGKLRFDVGFNGDAGAKLKLTVKSPSGKTQEKEGSSSFYIDVANAAQGNWEYTVTALTVPYANFPFTASVASAKKN
jgi:hypothetical protein